MKDKMEELFDYKILESLGETRNYYTCRAGKENIKDTFIIKILKTTRSSMPEIARFRQKYESILKNDISGIIRTYEIKNYKDSFALILEDFPGIPLKDHIIKDKCTINSFLTIAINLTNTLGFLHKARIFHQEITPRNILIKTDNSEVKITDFGIISDLTHSNENIYHEEFIDEILPYISPEQTGRTNRTIDYRTDIYSLGVVFYEILTGRLPFKYSEPLKMLHSIVAIKPESVMDLNSIVPGIISDIVMKMIEKSPEERYQNAFGILADLRECRKQLSINSEIKYFTPGKYDISNRFIIPKKLFGRRIETEEIKSHFQNAGKGEKSVLLVSGRPGVGKSFLINEILRSSPLKKSYYITGKYDRFRLDVPYSAIIQALQGLIKQILTESEESIKAWRTRLFDALGPNGKLITDIIPELELIIGKQGEIPDIGPEETRNRFNLYFERFLSAFTDSSRPLILFLDDLQWADIPSLLFIKNIIQSRDIGSMLFIGSYRDNEVYENHSLVKTLNEVEKTKIKINKITVPPLTEDEVNELISGFLKCSPAKIKPLTRVVFQKTGGNPLFINQFMLSIYNEKFLELYPDEGWRWDVEKIKRMRVTDNVVELMTGAIHKLPEETRDILKLCACAGNRCDIETIANMKNISINEVLGNLTEAVDEGYLSFSGSMYMFNHDRIQEAVYSLIPEEIKNQLHYKIGVAALKTKRNDQLYDNIYYIVNQMNLGKALLSAYNETDELAGLNLFAARKAKDSAAFISAVNYLRTGMSLLSGDSWTRNYKLTYSLYIERAECEYLTGNFNEAERLFDIIIKNAVNELDIIRVYNIMIILYTNIGKINDAVDLGLSALRILGVKLRRNPSLFNLLIKILNLKWNINRIKIESIINFKTIEDPAKLAVVELLNNTGTPAFYINKKLFALMALVLINDYYLKYGNTEGSPPGYTALGTIFGSSLGDYKTCCKFGDLALKLDEKYNADKPSCQVNFLYAYFIQHWKDRAKNSTAFFKKAYKYGLESGDIIYSGHCINIMTLYRVIIGDNLTGVLEEYILYGDFLKSTKDPFIIMNFVDNTKMLLKLKGIEESAVLSDYDYKDEDERLTKIREENNETELSNHLHNKIKIHYLLGDYGKCLEYARELDCIEIPPGTLFQPEHYYYYSLVLFSLIHSAPARVKRGYLKIIKRNLKKLKLYSKHQPVNFLHKYRLIEAELARYRGRKLKAAEGYDSAIKAAFENGFKNDEAIANELAAGFYLQNARTKIARLYMREARECYLEWGATVKVSQLQDKYNYLLKTGTEISNRASSVSESGHLSENALINKATSSLDFSSVMKASQAISKEIVMGSLLGKIMEIVIENAGAEKGFLILRNNNRLLTEVGVYAGGKTETFFNPVDVDEFTEVSRAVIHYTARTLESVVLGNACLNSDFMDDPHIRNSRIRSVLSLPIIRQKELLGIIYIENNQVTDAFTPERVEILNFLASQAAISLENAVLYENMMRNQKELQESEEKYRTILESIGDGYFECDDNGRCIFCNEAMAGILGYPGDEVKLLNFKNLISEDDLKNVLLTYSNVYKSGVPVKGLEFEIIQKDDTRRRVENSVSLVLNKETGEKFFRGIIRDITEKKLSDELRIAKDVAEASAKSKSEFLANMSHEIRTPLNPIIGMTKLAMEENVSPVVYRYLDTVVKSAHSLMYIINDILDFSKIEAGKLDMEMINFRLNEVLDHVYEMFREKASEKGIDLIVKVSDDVPASISGDPVRLEQILNNLVSNSIKFTERGKIIINVNCIEDNPSNTVLEFSVSDTGIGIESEMNEKLFKAFSQGDPSVTRRYGGTGLGLAICSRLVKMMGGEMYVESEAGDGSTFTFTATFVTHERLYAETGNVQKEEKRDLPSLMEGLKGRNILIVEDNKINQELAYKILMRAGMNAVIASNGAEALEALNRESFDAVLMDVQMPVMDGYTATEKIREDPRFNELPVIAMTAHAISDEINNCKTAGMNDYIPKPVNINELFNTLDRWINKKNSSPKVSGNKEQDAIENTDNSAFAPVEGIDIKSGLERVLGDRDLFVKLLISFNGSNTGTAEAIRSALQEKDYELARGQVHAVKGSAGNISAVDLHSVSEKFENALKNRDENIEDLFSNFRLELERVLKSTASLYESEIPR